MTTSVPSAKTVLVADDTAFVRDRAIWVAPLDGSSQARRIIATRGSAGSPEWAPDGSRMPTHSLLVLPRSTFANLTSALALVVALGDRSAEDRHVDRNLAVAQEGGIAVRSVPGKADLELLEVHEPESVLAGFDDEFLGRRDVRELITCRLADIGRQRGDIDQSRHFRAGARLGDDGAAIGMADEDRRPILAIEDSPGFLRSNHGREIGAGPCRSDRHPPTGVGAAHASNDD